MASPASVSAPSLQPQNAGIASSGLQADTMFSELRDTVTANPDLVKSVKGSFLFQITDGDKMEGNYHLLRTNHNSIYTYFAICSTACPPKKLFHIYISCVC